MADITSLQTTDTFRTWFNKTNEVVDRLNQNVLRSGQVANGTFVANGSLQVLSTFLANASLVLVTGNTRIDANATVSSNCNVFNMAAGTLLIQPLLGTFVNTAISINAISTFLGPIAANANVVITSGDLSLTGNALFNGTFQSNNGPCLVRQVLFASANAMVAPAALTNPQYNDYTTTGLTEAQILNLTPNIDTVFTGITAPTNVPIGGRILYVQNQSPTYKITLVSANTSSAANNQFKLSGDTPLDLPPGTSLSILWTTVNKTWRPLGAAASSFSTLTVNGVASFGNTTINGWINVASSLQVAGLSTQTGNAEFGGYANIATTLQVAGISTLTGNATMSGFANVAGKLVVGGNTAVTGNTTLTGFANLLSTLVVAGLTTLTGNATMSGTALVSGTSVFNANSTFNGTRMFANGQLRCDTTNGRLVLPVGAALYAT